MNKRRLKELRGKRKIAYEAYQRWMYAGSLTMKERCRQQLAKIDKQIKELEEE